MSNFTWDRVPLLSTPQLHLRALTPDDRQDLLAIYGDPAVMHYTSDPPFPDLSYVDQMLSNVAALFQQRQSLEWGVTLQSNGQVIGTCGIHSFNEQRKGAEIGCLLNRTYWGQSLMREALEVVIEFGFNTLQLAVLRADIDAPNTRSIKLFQRLGFQQENPLGMMYSRRKLSEPVQWREQERDKVTIPAHCSSCKCRIFAFDFARSARYVIQTRHRDSRPTTRCTGLAEDRAVPCKFLRPCCLV